MQSTIDDERCLWQLGSNKQMLTTEKEVNFQEKNAYTLVQWWRHFIILLYQHVVIGSEQTNHQPEHESDDREGDTVTSLCVCNQWERYGTSAQNLSLNCGAVKLELQTEPGYWFLESLVRYDFQNLPTILAYFFSKIILKTVAILMSLQ